MIWKGFGFPIYPLGKPSLREGNWCSRRIGPEVNYFRGLTTNSKMARLLCILSITALGSVIAAETPYFRIAEAFTPSHGQQLDVSYRVYTAPILSEILASGVLVERLEISPSEIRLEVGETFSLQQLRITAFGPDGNIQEHIPLTLDLEGPAELLDFEDFKVYGDEIRAAQSGQASIWVTSGVPSLSGENIRQSILVVVDD